MGSCLSSFAKNETDLNNNGLGDRDEICLLYTSDAADE